MLNFFQKDIGLGNPADKLIITDGQDFENVRLRWLCCHVSK